MKSFFQGKKTVSIPALRLPPGLGTHAGPTRNARHAESARKPGCAGAEPQVEVVKEGDRVVRLVVTCTCGERVEVECLYPAGS